MANTKERMKGAKEGYEGRMLGKMGGDYKNKDGKGKKGDDWLLKRGVWEKQVRTSVKTLFTFLVLQKPDTVAMVVREVMVSSVCNTSRQPQLNQGSVEFNVTDDFLNSTRLYFNLMHWNLENDKFNLKLFSGLSMCQKCFLQTPMDQVETSIKQQNKTKCSGPHMCLVCSY